MVDTMQTPENNTHFCFEHKIFAVDGAHFSLTRDDHEPALFMNVGEHDAAITFDSLMMEFDINAGSADSSMLGKVAEGLRFVRDIRPGDSILNELLDCSASWSIEEEHRDRARNKLDYAVAVLGA